MPQIPLSLQLNSQQQDGTADKKGKDDCFGQTLSKVRIVPNSLWAVERTDQAQPEMF